MWVRVIEGWKAQGVKKKDSGKITNSRHQTPLQAEK
jgi:hypothetical protein